MSIAPHTKVRADRIAHIDRADRIEPYEAAQRAGAGADAALSVVGELP